MNQLRVLMPLPHADFDPTEAGIPWKILMANGIEVVFATPKASVASADHVMVTGRGLGILSALLRADANGRLAYSDMIQSSEFKNPIAWADAKSEDYAALLLPGGHAPGMREYLESVVLQKLTSDFFAASKLVGAICHGVVLASRSQRADHRSVLYGYRATALLETQEMAAWQLTRLWLGSYYRTYPESVESEVSLSLENPDDFQKGPFPLFRDSDIHLKRGFAVTDRNFISARWPGDAHAFAYEFLKCLRETLS